MSLKPCRDCGHEVSSDASLCPHCGCANPGKEKHPGAGKFIFFFLILALLAAVIKTLMEKGL